VALRPDQFPHPFGRERAPTRRLTALAGKELTGNDSPGFVEVSNVWGRVHALQGGCGSSLARLDLGK
jgi:hypothetical protein